MIRKHLHLGVFFTTLCQFAMSLLIFPMTTTQAAPSHVETFLNKRSLPVRASLAPSPDGLWMAMVVHGLPPGEVIAATQGEVQPAMAISEEVAGSEVVVVNTKTGEVKQPFRNFNTSCLPIWSPDGKWLALLTQSGERRYPRVTLWSPTESTPRAFAEAPASPLTSFQVLRWTKDSRRIVFMVIDAPDETKPLVTRLRTDEPNEDRMSRFYNSQSLGVLDIATGKVAKFGSTTMTWAARLSPDNRFAALLRYTSLPDKPQNTQANWRQLVVTNLANGTEQLIGEPQTDTWGSAFNWSPDGRAVAWLAAAHHSPTKLFVAELGDKPGLREITLPEGTSFGFTSIGWYPPPAPVWSSDSTSFYIPGQAKLWRFARAGEVKGAVALPEGEKFDWFTNSIACLDFPRDTPIEEDGDVLLWRPHEVWKVNLASEKSVLLWKKDIEVDFWRNEPDTPTRRNFGIERASDTGRTTLYTARVSAEGVIKLYGTNLTSGKSRVVSTLFANAGVPEFGLVRSLSWKLPDGTDCGGSLLLPTGWREGDKPPVVMQVYGGSQGKGNLSAAGFHDESMVVNAHLLSANGYAVWVPDMPQSTDQPAASLVAAGVAAVEALRASGLVDTDRIVVTGSSYGGYTTMCLVTGTKLFKAAVPANGIYDLLRSATDGDWGWAETGQGRMRTSIWENPARYIENSPLYSLDKLEVPVLILQGGSDEGTLRQGEALFAALRRLDKPAEMLIYRDAGHAPTYWSVAAQRDWHRRLLAFLDEHLKKN